MANRKKELTERIEIRVSEFEKNRFQWIANKYAGGNISLLVVYAVMNFSRMKIDPESIEEYSKRRNKKGPE